MDMIFLPIIFSVWAAISFLLLLQAILSRENLLQFMAVTTPVIHQAFHWTQDSYFGCLLQATQDVSGCRSHVGFS
jgi:hypothetical protein